MTSFSESVSLPPSIVSLHRVSPIRLQLGSASVISVQVLGDPLPWVSWFVGKNRIQTTNPNFRAEGVGDGRRHNLRVSKVTRELDEGVAIEARNDSGTDYRKLAIAISQGRHKFFFVLSNFILFCLVYFSDSKSLRDVISAGSLYKFCRGAI